MTFPSRNPQNIDRMLANALVELFVKGGPIMWPILLVAIVLVSVVAERSVFWFLQGRRRDAAAAPSSLHRHRPARKEGSPARGEQLTRGRDALQRVDST